MKHIRPPKTNSWIEDLILALLFFVFLAVMYMLADLIEGVLHEPVQEVISEHHSRSQRNTE